MIYIWYKSLFFKKYKYTYVTEFHSEVWILLSGDLDWRLKWQWQLLLILSFKKMKEKRSSLCTTRIRTKFYSKIFFEQVDITFFKILEIISMKFLLTLEFWHKNRVVKVPIYCSFIILSSLKTLFTDMFHASIKNFKKMKML